LINLDKEQMTIDENPHGTTAASVEGLSVNTTVTESESAGRGQIVPENESHFGPKNVQKQLDLTDQQQKDTGEHETQRREDEALGESAVKLAGKLGSADTTANDQQPKDQHIKTEQSGTKTTNNKYVNKHNTKSQHTQLIWQPKKVQDAKDQVPKDQHEINPKRTKQPVKEQQLKQNQQPKDLQPTDQHPDEHIGSNKNALLIKGHIGEFGKLLKLESKFLIVENTHKNRESINFPKKILNLPSKP
jgi:hypothetical protein